MGSYKIKPSAINNGAINMDHLNINTYDIITTDGVKFLGGSENNSKFTSVDAIVSKLKNMHGSDLTNNNIKSHLGHFVASIVSDDTKISFFDILSNCTNPDNDIWIQSITGNLTLNNGKLEYSSDNIGTFVRKHISGSWSVWKISNNIEITDNNSEIIKRLQGTSENNQFKDPFKTINVEPSKVINALNGQEVTDSKGNIINLTPYTANNISYNTGNYRSYSTSGSSFLDLKIYALDWKNKKYMQSVFGPITYTPSTGELKWVNGLEIGEFYRISSSGKDSQGNDVVVWGEWNPVNKKEIEYIIQGEDDSCKPFNRPFKVLRKSEESLIFKDINDNDLWKRIDDLHVSTSDYGNTEGTWRFYIGYMPIDVKVIARHYKSDLWYQSFESIYKYSKTDKKFYLDANDIKLRTYYRNRINPDNEVVKDGMTVEEISAIINKNKWTEWSDVTDNIFEELQTNTNSITNEVTRAKQAETELIKRLQGNSGRCVNFDPFIKLSWEPSNQDINDNMNNLCPSNNDLSFKTGHFRAYSSAGASCLDIKVDVLSWANDNGTKEIFMQTVSGPVTLMDNNTKLYWVNGVPSSGSGCYYRLSERAKNETDRRWSEWKPVNNSYIESLQNQVNLLKQQIESILNTINTISIK